MDAYGRRIPGTCLILAFWLAACGGDAGDGGETPDAAAAPASESAGEQGTASESGYTVVAVEDAGAIHGVVLFAGTVPAARTVEVTEDADECGETVQIQTLEVGSGQELANVVVSLKDIDRGAALDVPASPPSLDQHGCQFSPHVLLSGVDQTVAILNSDPMSHNVHTVSFDNRPVNKMQPPELEKLEVTFGVAEKVKVRCDIHEWMSAWVVVADHPYYAITGADGSFALENVPPGTYTLEVWHEDLGSTTRTVTVAAGEDTEMSFELTPDGQEH